MTTSEKSAITWVSVDLAKSTEKAFSKECRSSPRYRCAGLVEVAVPGTPVRHSGPLHDLSMTGCRIHAPSLVALAKSTAVEVLLDIDGFKLRLPAILVWSDNQHGTGFRFGALSSRNAAMIHQICGELAAKAEAAAAKK